MTTRSLIVTADDFGYDSAVNEAVIRAYREGVLRYASLMVDRPGAEEAARLARENPGLGVGLHLELCGDHPGLWGMRYFFSPSDRARIKPEIERQFDKLGALGISPTHADGHFNIHVHPVIFPLLRRSCERRGVPRLRLPGGELSACLGYRRDHALSRSGLAAAFGTLRAGLRPRRGNVEVPERTFGLLRSGTMTEDYLLWLIERLPPGETEIYLHPSARSGSEVEDVPTPTHHTLTELRSLLSPRVREALRQRGVVLRQKTGY
ncbi:MAG: ChbG/HpnK family deacetylase [Elusimicrobia bacterium]|nr:ChbG/HpnK family deacetylase [Elusimicrobiota bacterium]MDE2424909.1 ChbG/HpnK family deacetylase [Elusimicrobiota bacterium]